MRPSLRKHVLVLLRETLELKQTGFATLVGAGLSTIQHIEAGRLPLSEKLAQQISSITCVNKQWLLENNHSKPIISRAGRPYTKQLFESMSGEDKTGEALFAMVKDLIMATQCSISALRSILLHAYETDRSPLAIYRIQVLIEKLGADFPRRFTYVERMSKVKSAEAKVGKVISDHEAFGLIVSELLTKKFKKKFPKTYAAQFDKAKAAFLAADKESAADS
jgi:DNA-binding XRE family transcriptional regulator